LPSLRSSTGHELGRSNSHKSPAADGGARTAGRNVNYLRTYVLYNVHIFIYLWDHDPRKCGEGGRGGERVLGTGEAKGVHITVRGNKVRRGFHILGVQHWLSQRHRQREREREKERERERESERDAFVWPMCFCLRRTIVYIYTYTASSRYREWCSIATLSTQTSKYTNGYRDGAFKRDASKLDPI
jgi:hypothetical protein